MSKLHAYCEKLNPTFLTRLDNQNNFANFMIQKQDCVKVIIRVIKICQPAICAPLHHRKSIVTRRNVRNDASGSFETNNLAGGTAMWFS